MDAIAQKLSAISWQYADDDRRAYDELASRVAAVGRQGKTVTYSDLVSGVTFRLNDYEPFEIPAGPWDSFHRQVVGDFLGRLNVETYNRGRFMGSALVVSKTDMRPSVGFEKFVTETLGATTKASIDKYWIEQMKVAHAWYLANEW